MKLRVFVTVTSVDYLDSLDADAAGGESNWTLGKNGKARKGDRLLLYCKAPISGFVAEARIATKPGVLDEPGHEFNGSYCADIDDIKVFNCYVTREEVMAAIPEWGWPKQPRTAVEVPEAYAERLLKLIEERR
jgi:hypothetical protein